MFSCFEEVAHMVPSHMHLHCWKKDNFSKPFYKDSQDTLGQSVCLLRNTFLET